MPLVVLDSPVSDSVFQLPADTRVMRMCSNDGFPPPYYIEEGKLGLTIAIGCTGGRHRSVAIAAELNKYLNVKGIGAVSVHRDMER